MGASLENQKKSSIMNQTPKKSADLPRIFWNPDCNKNSKISWKCRQFRILAYLELVLALIALAYGISSIIVISKHNFFNGAQNCTAGTSIWAAVLGVICGSLGLRATRTQGTPANPRVLTAHFIMCVFSVGGFSILIIFTGLCLSDLYWVSKSTGIASHAVLASIVMECMIVTVAIVNVICCIVCIILICLYWLKRHSDQNDQSVVYIVPACSVEGQPKPTGGVSLPQVIFVPSSVKTGHHFVGQ